MKEIFLLWKALATSRSMGTRVLSLDIAAAEIS
jgi:hypothetical protein